MNDADGERGVAEAVLDLEEATWIAGGDDIGAGGFDVGHLAMEEVIGHFGLNEVVNAGAAAAPGAFRKFHEF